MTSKDYIKIAGAMREAYGDAYNGDQRIGVTLATAKVCLTLKADNPRFDTQHFVDVVTGQRELTSRPSKKVVKL